jgi:hypothetical protein
MMNGTNKNRKREKTKKKNRKLSGSFYFSFISLDKHKKLNIFGTRAL